MATGSVQGGDLEDLRVAYPRELAAEEARLIEQRRELARLPDVNELATVGLALSGGGIRSATFSLGVLQALTKRTMPSTGRPLLKCVDYLSTVSGGGYIGGFLGMALQRKSGAPVDEALEPLRSERSEELKWLRENGRYLSPNGGGDLLLAGAIMLRNWLTVQLVLATFFVVPFLALRLGDALAALLKLPSVLASDGFWTAACVLPLGGAVMTLVFGLAYWLLPDGPQVKVARPRRVVVALSVLLSAVALLRGWVHAIPWRSLSAVAAAMLVAAWLCGYALKRPEPARIQGTRESGADDTDDTVGKTGRARRWLSARLASWLGLTGSLLALALCDALGRSLYSHRDLSWPVLASVFVPLSGFVASAQKVAALVTKRQDRRSSVQASAAPLPLAFLALVLAALLVAAFLSGLASLTYGLQQAFNSLGDTASVLSGVGFAAAVVLTVLVNLMIGGMRSLVNYTSLATLYSARLARAYLGASNPERRKPENESVLEVVRNDDPLFCQYQPHASGGPLHILNLTLNETVLGRSQVEQRDRKGLPFSIGPAGISVGVRHHASWDASRKRLIPIPLSHEREALGSKTPLNTAGDKAADPPQQLSEAVFVGQTDAPIDPEELSLGRWIGLSGAAVSTGLGSRTSLGTSLLCGLLNLRLGHWWWSGTEPKRRLWWALRQDRLARWMSRGFAVQMHLLDELLARFPGTASRHWYLTDGGHFENTGVYELLRRRVPFIISVDAGADGGYVFEDAAELVRKARLDFGANIRFLSPKELEGSVDEELRACFRDMGTTKRAKPDPRTRHRYAVLATVEYDDQPAQRGVLLMIKPGLMGSEPLDVLTYARMHDDFPHESTADQFFDEAQWESYRCLGEHIASRLFDDSLEASGWRPATLDAKAFLEAMERARHQQIVRATYIRSLRLQARESLRVDSK